MAYCASVSIGYGLNARLNAIFEYDIVDRLQRPFELYRQLPKILFEVLTVFWFSYAIHTWSFFSPQAVVADSQVIHIIDVMM